MRHQAKSATTKQNYDLSHRQDACKIFTKFRNREAFGVRLIAPQPSNKAKLFHA